MDEDVRKRSRDTSSLLIIVSWLFLLLGIFGGVVLAAEDQFVNAVLSAASGFFVYLSIRALSVIIDLLIEIGERKTIPINE